MQRPPVRQPDWAADATEARRQRDEAAKQRVAEVAQQRQQAREAANAWSPRHEVQALTSVLRKSAPMLAEVVPAAAAARRPPQPTGPKAVAAALFKQAVAHAQRQPTRQENSPTCPSQY